MLQRAERHTENRSHTDTKHPVAVTCHCYGVLSKFTTGGLGPGASACEINIVICVGQVNKDCLHAGAT